MDTMEMTRIRYVGRKGELDDSRLAGLREIDHGHALDVPYWLALELVSRGPFVWPADYYPEATPSLEEDMPTLVEINEFDLGEDDGFVEVSDGEDETWLRAGDLPRLGQVRLEHLRSAGLGTWQAIAGLTEDGCSEAAALTGVSEKTAQGWRDEARLYLQAEWDM